MESFLWALDLMAVTWLCLWILKAEKRKEQALREQEAQRSKEPGGSEHA